MDKTTSLKRIYGIPSFMVYWSGEVTVIYIFASLLKSGLLSKDCICSSWSKFFPLRVNPNLEAMSAKEVNRKSLKLFPFVKMAEKHGVKQPGPALHCLLFCQWFLFTKITNMNLE